VRLWAPALGKKKRKGKTLKKTKQNIMSQTNRVETYQL
jgi:hypothetical protein